MAMSAAEILKRLKQSSGGRRTAFNRAVKNGQRLVESVGLHPSSLAMKLLEEAHDNLKVSYESLAACLIEIIELTEESLVEQYEQKLVELDDQYHEASGTILQALKPSAVSRVSSAVPVVGGATPHRSFRIDDSLKPKVLSLDMNPAEFRAWSAPMQDWHSFNNMSQFPLSQQHRFLFNVVDINWWTALEGHIQPDTPIMSEDDSVDSCLKFLRDEFDSRYPLIQRRALYFRYSQPKQMRFTEYLNQLLLHGAEADLHTLDVNGIHCFKAIIGASDPVLREKLLKLDSLDLESIKKEARAYKVANEVAKAIDNPGKSAKLSSFQQKKKQPSASRKQEQLRRQGLCFNCGQKRHENVNVCPQRATLHCTKCDKNGHVSSVCMRDQSSAKSSGSSQGEEETAVQTSSDADD